MEIQAGLDPFTMYRYIINRDSRGLERYLNSMMGTYGANKWFMEREMPIMLSIPVAVSGRYRCVASCRLGDCRIDCLVFNSFADTIYAFEFRTDCDEREMESIAEDALRTLRMKTEGRFPRRRVTMYGVAIRGRSSKVVSGTDAPMLHFS